MDRLFVDANILFSAAYSRSSSLRQLWNLADTELVSSPFAIQESDACSPFYPNPSNFPLLSPNDFTGAPNGLSWTARAG